MLLSISPIPSRVQHIADYILLGIFLSFGVIGLPKEKKERKIAIIVHIVVWCAFIVAIVSKFI